MKRILCLLCLALLPALAARGDTLTLPEGALTLEAEAFLGDLSLDEVVLPAELRAVGDRAFYGCASLDIAEIPGADTAVGAEAFAGCGEALLIRAPYGSPAHAYALAHSLDYQAGTRYRALVISNSYAGTENELGGPPRDSRNMQALLAGMPGISWEVTARAELTAEGIPAAILSCFASADDTDVSLIYYSGHGALTDWGACLVGTDQYGCFAGDLRQALDQIPGRKILIIDACYSGGVLNDMVTTADAAEGEGTDPTAAFVSGILAPFRIRSRAAGDGSCFVMAACAADERSYELGPEDDSDRYGAFTSQLLTGLGYAVPGYAWSEPPADANGDRAVSFAEAFDYAMTRTRDMMARYGESQNAACWPSACFWFAPFRYR